MTDDRWPMADGRWPMADGRWPMADGRWSMADGRWSMADIRYPITDSLTLEAFFQFAEAPLQIRDGFLELGKFAEDGG